MFLINAPKLNGHKKNLNSYFSLYKRNSESTGDFNVEQEECAHGQEGPNEEKL